VEQRSSATLPHQFSTSFSLKLGRSSTSPNRSPLTNGSIMNGNINRFLREVNGNVVQPGGGVAAAGGPAAGEPAGPGQEPFEVPLPFGYHLDLDFLRVCSGELVSGETLQKLKDLKKTRRKQRKELEALMGLRQEKLREPEVRGVTTRQTINIRTPPRTLKLDQPDIVNSSELVREALRESMQSFQETLDKYKEEEEALSNLDLISTSTPTNKAKFSTFPRGPASLGSPEEPLGLTKLSRQLSNSSISSVSTVSSAALHYPLTPEAYLASLPSSVSAKQEEMDTNSIGSISSEMSTNTLRTVREQMARSLVKLKEYEKQVEAIPMLQVKLSVLKEEKRLLMLRLKAREAKLRRDRGEPGYESDGAFDSQAFDEEMDTDDEDLDSRVAKMSDSLHRKAGLGGGVRRARSESPYAKCATVHPEDFISFQRKRSTSCGFNSDSSDVSPSGGRKYYTQDSPEFAARKARFSRGAGPDNGHAAVETRELGVNTERPPSPPVPAVPPRPATLDRAANTDPPPKSPPPPRKVNHGTNTLKTRSIPKGTGTDIRMGEVLSKEELEHKIQDAVFRTEEEIMSCPLLQKAMQKVEEEALKGEEPEKEFSEAGCQVGMENLRPFVIDVGVECELGLMSTPRPETSDSWSQVSLARAATREASCGPTGVEPRLGLVSRGVGDCLVVEAPAEPARYRTVGVCTEKWVEVIRASKQTDTEDFKYRDTESPRVADLPWEPPLEPISERRQRLSSLTAPCLRKSMEREHGRASPGVSRRSSTASPSQSRKSSAASTTQTERRTEQRSRGTMTAGEMRAVQPTRDAGTTTPQPDRPTTKSVATSALILPLTKQLPAPGSPLSTPEAEKPAISLNLCDKCDKDIHQVALGILAPPSAPAIAPPSPDTPWVSKIPRPCPMENPEVSRLKGATSTGNLSSLTSRSKSPSGIPQMQRSKSNLEPSPNKFSLATGRSGGMSTPPPARRDLGTPPPHPKTPPVGSRRAPSPLARSPAPATGMSRSYTAGDKSSMIPKFSPGPQRKAAGKTTAGDSSPKISSPLAEQKSLIPRVVTPPALRKMFPKDSKEDNKAEKAALVRKKTYNHKQAGVTNPDLESPKPEPSKKKMEDIKESLTDDSGDETETLDDTEGSNKKASASFPLPGAALFSPIEAAQAGGRKKAEPSKEMDGALKVLNDSLGRPAGSRTTQVTNAVNIIQQEWFKTSSTKTSDPLAVQDYIACIGNISAELLDQVINLADVNGNTALHYSVSHGNFDVVSILLDTKVANGNILNKAGYTCSMLISLAVISSETHRSVVRKLFSLADLNLRASQHGQTALMLAVSHGRLDMVDLLLEAGADLNIRDEDGSTALMCAAEHGHAEIVKVLMTHPDININATDNDGLSALSVAMEAGHRDIGVLLYANMSFSRGASPHSSMRMKKGTGGGSGRGSIATTPSASSPVPPTPPHRSRRNSSNM